MRHLPAFLLSLCTVCSAVVEGPYVVTAIADGDTITVRRGTIDEPIRLIAVDTPEKTDHRAREGIHAARPSGQVATRVLSEMLPIGTRVWLRSDGPELERDNHERLLAVVFLDINLTPGLTLQYKLLAGGWSPLVTKYDNVPKWMDASLRAAETEARDANKGLWKTDREYMDGVSGENAPVANALAVKQPPVHTRVVITTSMGTVVAELFDDEAPVTVANFLGLAQGQKTFTDPKTNKEVKRPFYDGLIFHRVIKGFMIQGGCPLGQGTSGPGYKFKDEINAKSLGLDREMAFVGENLNPLCSYMTRDFMRVMIRPRMEALGITAESTMEQQQKAFDGVLEEVHLLSLQDFFEKLGYAYENTLPPSHKPFRGVLAMANSGPGTNGSQFFINLGDTPHLAGKHTVFGKVITGMEVVDAIGNVAVAEGDRPKKPVVIQSIRR